MKKAFILGGTNAHGELIRNLKARAYQTYLIDYLDSPPAAAFADVHIRESALDRIRVLEICKDHAADLVISICIDQAMVTAAYVAEELDLPAHISYQTSLDVTNKILMKERMLASGVPSSRFKIVNDLSEVLDIDLHYPLVVKPADSNSSKGVRKADNLDELKAFAGDAFNISRDNRIIVEEFAEGTEVGMDCFVQNKKAKIIMMHRKRKPMLDNHDVLFSIGSVSPPDIEPGAHQKLQSVADLIVQSFGLDNCPLLIQAVVNGPDIKVLEFSPRIGGGLNFRTIKKYRNFDIIDAATDSFLGLEVNVEYSVPKFYHAENHLYARDGIFDHLTGVDDLVQSGVIDEFYPNKAQGYQVTGDMASNNRIASFFCKADSLLGLENKVRTAFEVLRVNDQRGENIMNTKIYKDLMILQKM